MGVLVGLALVLTVLSGCGGTEPGAGTPSDPLRVVAAFYPLQWLAEQVGGERVEVTNLTEPGGEPHDLELNPSDVAAVQDADVVAYLSDFQPPVDTAVADAPGEIFDAKELADLDITVTSEPIEGQDHGHDGTMDPHFWLDPARMARGAEMMAATLSERDPDHAADYQANATALRTQLEQLDAHMADGLAHCLSNNLVTSHAAFGYLADRYGFQQVGITGLTPEAEPSPKALAAVADYVRDHEVGTIYFEMLVSPDIAKTIAAETGAETSVLTTLESLSPDEPDGADYVSVMQRNLTALVAGQGC